MQTAALPLDHTPEADFVAIVDFGGDGARVGVKDTIDIAGYPSRAGSRALENTPAAARNADVVDALLNAGCRIVGKTNMHELAFGVTGVNLWTGTPRNPLFPDYVPGGSSSGSATAVAGGRVDFALGTDTGGSVRTPAACCGVFGLKPTFGRISRRGVAPGKTSLDCVGVFTRDTDMLARAMAILEPGFNVPSLDAPPRVGLVAVEARPEIADLVRDAFAGTDAVIENMKLPGLEAAFHAGIAIIGSETAAAFGPLLASGKVGSDVAARIKAGGEVSPTALAAAEQVRAAFTAEVDALLARVDVLALPTLPDYPPTLAEATDAVKAVPMTRLVRQFNMSGHPAISVPLRDPGHRPVGLQLVGRKGDDEHLCAVAAYIAARSSLILHDNA